MDGAWRLTHGSVALAVGLAVALAFVFAAEARLPASRRRRVARALVRGAILAAVATAIAGPAALRDAPAPRRLVVAIDRASLADPAGRAAAAHLVANAVLATRGDGIELAVLRFGRTADPIDPAAAFSSDADPAGGPSSLAAALAAARLSIDADAAGAIVLVSDGRGDARGAKVAAEALRASGVPVRPVVLPPPPAPRAKTPMIEALAVPAIARGPFAVHVAVSRIEGVWMARLLVDGIETERVAIGRTQPATSTGEAIFDAVTLAPGLHEVAVALAEVLEPATRAPTDALPPDAPVVLRRALVRVTAPPRVLVVSSASESNAARRALAAQGVEPTVVSASGLDAALAASPDVVVLDADTPLPEATAAHLVERVREGTGLLLLAGRSADAWGALGRSPLAAVLPLLPAPPPPAPPPPPPPPPEDPPEAPPPPDRTPDPGPGLVAERRPEEALPISLLLVIDRSGSMEGEPIRLAVLAAEMAASTLAKTDRVGVVSFADEPTLDLPMRPAGDVASGGLVSIPRADGNTDLLRAIAAAERVMRAETNPIRHVILLTDGRPSREAFYADIVGRLRDDAVTLTVVGLGHDIDLGLLNRLAALAGGRVLLARNPHEVPRVFTVDTKRVLDSRADAAAKAPRVDDPAARPPEKPKTPPPTPKPALPKPPRPGPPTPPARPPPAATARLRRVRSHEALAGFEDGTFPAIAPPFPSTVARGAGLLLEREDALPALAAGRAGLGRSIAWAAPADDARVLDWALWPRLLAQTVRSLLPPTEAAAVPTVRVTREPRGDVLRVALSDASASAAGLRVTKDDPRTNVPAAAAPLGVEDGEAAFLLPPAGSDESVAVAHVTGLSGIEGPGTSVPPIAYLPRGGEPRERGGDPAALEAALGARPSAPDTPDLFAVPPRIHEVESPLFAWFVALALLLLPFDVALHRRSAPGSSARS